MKRKKNPTIPSKIAMGVNGTKHNTTRKRIIAGILLSITLNSERWLNELEESILLLKHNIIFFRTVGKYMVTKLTMKIPINRPINEYAIY